MVPALAHVDMKPEQLLLRPLYCAVLCTVLYCARCASALLRPPTPTLTFTTLGLPGFWSLPSTAAGRKAGWVKG